VLLANYEAELYTTLQQIQALPPTTVLDNEVEAYIVALVKTIKVLRFLLRDKWETCSEPEQEVVYIRSDNEQRLIVTRRMLRRNVVGDILALKTIIIPYKLYVSSDVGEEVYQLDLPIDYVHIYVKAKHLSLPQPTTKLTKVLLKDGNVAWLTSNMLKKVQSMLNQETEENV
jgi:hypothetical protein